MHTHATESANGQVGLGAAVKEVAEHASALVRLELELASLELKRKAGALGVGIGLALGAAVVAVFAIGFLFATIAAALATFLAWWLSLLIVCLFLFVVSGVLAFAGVSSIRKGTPPVPNQAIHEAKVTTTALKSE
jgi:hypothetical protein